MDTVPEPDPGRREIERTRGELRFEGVSVWHAGADRPALEDVGLEIGPGRTVALVGASGLGVPVVRALNSVNTALGFESGFIIVIVAIMLDRMLRVGKHHD